MAQEILIKLIVDDGQLEQTERDIKSLGGSIEKVEKTTKKTGDNIGKSFDDAGSAANNLQGGVEGAVSQVKVLGKAAKTSGAAMRSALISTGIGALIVAVGLLVDNWESISKFIGLSDTKLQDLIDTQNRQIDNLDFQLTLLKEQEKTSKLLGESTVGNRKEQEKTLLLLQEANVERLEALKTQLQTEKSQAKELSFFEKLLNFRSGSPAKVTAGGISEEEQKQLDETNKQLQEAEVRAEKLKQALIEINQPDKAKGGGGATDRDKATAVDAGLESGIADPYNEQKELDALRAQALREGTEEFVGLQNERLDKQAETLVRWAGLINKQTEIERKAAEEKAEIERILTQQKEEQNNVRLASADALGSALFKLGEHSKAAAVAGIIVDQVAGAAQAIQANVVANAKAVAAFPLTGGQPWVTINTASTIAGIAAGALSAKKAISEIGGGGSVGSVGGLPQGGQASAPSFNVVGTSGVNQLAQTLGNDETPIRAYVVGGDVTNQQEFERNVQDTSSIG